jgi:hypothetical protein
VPAHKKTNKHAQPRAHTHIIISYFTITTTTTVAEREAAQTAAMEGGKICGRSK